MVLVERCGGWLRSTLNDERGILFILAVLT